MKRLLSIILISITLSGCFWDEQTEVTPLTKEFNLGWWSQPKYQALFLNSENDKYGGEVVIPETVYQIGYDDDFIIAKRYFNLEKSISESLFGQHEKGGDFVISNPQDTVYLPEDDVVYFENGRWYHKYNDWNPSDSLFPYVKMTYFYIIDIREYDYNNWIERKILGQYPMFEGYEKYEFTNQKEFEKKLAELNVSSEIKLMKVYGK